MIRQRLFVLPVLILAGVVASSCFFSARSPLSSIEGATGKALGADTVHFELSTSFEGLDDQSDADFFKVEAHGAFDATTNDSYLVIGAAGLDFEMRRIGKETFVRIYGDNWFKFEEDEASLFDSLYMPFFDPYELLKNLGVDPADVKHEGSETIRGKSAEQYSLTVSARDIDEDLVESFLGGARESHVEFWIGEDGLPARVSLSSTSDGQEFGATPGTDVTATITIEFFDYGVPLGIERPSDDEISDFGSFGSFGGNSVDPFEGAECYGDRLEECLAVDPETAAMAQNPGLCQGDEARVCLVPVGKVRPDVVQAIVDFHKETRGIDVVVLPSVPLRLSDVRADSSQVAETTVFRKLQGAFGVSDATASTFIGITPIDIVPENDEYGWEFGYRVGSGPYGNRHGVFSYFRMVNVEPYSGDPITARSDS